MCVKNKLYWLIRIYFPTLYNITLDCQTYITYYRTTYYKDFRNATN